MTIIATLFATAATATHGHATEGHLRVAQAPLPILEYQDVDSQLQLHDCLLAGAINRDSAARLRDEGWVPEGYPIHDPLLGPLDDADAVVFAWAFECERSTGAVTSSESIGLAYTGVALDYTNPLDPTQWHNVIELPMHYIGATAGLWGIYVVGVHTDNGALNGFLRRAGFPSELVPAIDIDEEPTGVDLGEMSIEVPVEADTCGPIGDLPGVYHSLPEELRPPEPAKTSTTAVASRRLGSFEFVTTPSGHHNTLTHCHDQVFWYGPPDDAATLQMVIPAARDHFCLMDVPTACGSINAEANSAMSDFFRAAGGPVASDLTIDHERIPVIHFVTNGAAGSGDAPGPSVGAGGNAADGGAGTLPASGGGAVFLAIAILTLVHVATRRQAREPA
ncbi:MAG: hypothetical protein R3249_05120 [Nitriliruptorales bacterium]|nr:hypothetical protein [Nitriliruptorales bacterium]